MINFLYIDIVTIEDCVNVCYFFFCFGFVLFLWIKTKRQTNKTTANGVCSSGIKQVKGESAIVSD